MKKVMANPDVRARLEAAGASPLGNTSAEYTAQMKQELEAMKRLITSRKISFED